MSTSACDALALNFANLGLGLKEIKNEKQFQITFQMAHARDDLSPGRERVACAADNAGAGQSRFAATSCYGYSGQWERRWRVWYTDCLGGSDLGSILR
jgi:hypothetical protein